MNRRQSIAALATVAGSLTTRVASAAEDSPLSDASTVRRFALVRGALDESLVIGGLTGLFSGMVDGELTPLFGVVGITFSTYRERPDGSFVIATLEQSYYTDQTCEHVLDDWLNPYTRRRVTVPVFRGPATRLVIRPDLRFEATLPAAVVAFRQSAERVAAVTGGLAFRETIDVKIGAQGASAPRFYHESVLFRADAPSGRAHGERMEADVSFTSLVSWRPWLQMAGIDGHLVGVGGGRKGLAMDQLPPQWVAATRATKPELTDPMPLLMAVLDA